MADLTLLLVRFTFLRTLTSKMLKITISQTLLPSTTMSFFITIPVVAILIYELFHRYLPNETFDKYGHFEYILWFMCFWIYLLSIVFWSVPKLYELLEKADKREAEEKARRVLLGEGDLLDLVGRERWVRLREGAWGRLRGAAWKWWKGVKGRMRKDVEEVRWWGEWKPQGGLWDDYVPGRDD